MRPRDLISAGTTRSDLTASVTRVMLGRVVTLISLRSPKDFVEAVGVGRKDESERVRKLGAETRMIEVWRNGAE